MLANRLSPFMFYIEIFHVKKEIICVLLGEFLTVIEGSKLAILVANPFDSEQKRVVHETVVLEEFHIPFNAGEDHPEVIVGNVDLDLFHFGKILKIDVLQSLILVIFEQK